ncbi:MAG: class I SAM-dependent methyltransferase [Verrucomicrobia bacterium]|nr:class I SAM-dependent methyltransferase [Verrucomicrobiota bacterium]MCH8511988.1 class I SAM-dependent methyltransferase [Kiritimatiellia bacterium]
MSRDEDVAAFWSEQNESNAFSPDVYWLANPILQRRYQQQATGGSSYPHWLNYCVGEILGENAPVERMLSIGCGTGELERHLARKKAFRRMDGVDIAPRSVETARKLAADEQWESIEYFCRDIEKSGFPGDAYDAIFYNMSLHHMFDVDAAVRRSAQALKPEGLLFLNEYIGPNRFDFSEREREALRAAFQLIPGKYRRSLEPKNKGKLLKEVSIPDPVTVSREDPSESVQSAEIVSAVERHFEVLAFHPIGGTLSQFLFHNIAGHFHEGDSESMRVLEMLIQIEDTLMRTKDIPPHFAFIAAKPK